LGDLSVEAQGEIVEEIAIGVIDGIEKYLIQNRIKRVAKLISLFRPHL